MLGGRFWAPPLKPGERRAPPVRRVSYVERGLESLAAEANESVASTDESDGAHRRGHWQRPWQADVREGPQARSRQWNC